MERSTKAKDKAKLALLLNRSRLDLPFEPGSDEHDFALGLTRSLPVVYSELAKENPPKFCIKSIKTVQGKSNRTLCVWSTTYNKNNKPKGWVPLSQVKIFTSGAPTSKKKRVLAALRTAIKGQIDYCRASTATPFICPISGITIIDKRNTHVDHYGTNIFQAIVEQWMNLNSLNYDYISLDRKGDLKDPEVFKSWYDFHQSKADLRLADKTANLKKGGKGRWVVPQE